MAKQKLTYNPEEFYNVIALATSLKDYRVSFFVNQLLHLELEKSDDLVIDLKKKSIVMSFGQHAYTDETRGLEYSLINNKSSNGVFLSSVKNFDFALVVKSQDDSIDIPFILDKLKSIDKVNAVVSLNNLNSKETKLIEKYI